MQNGVKSMCIRFCLLSWLSSLRVQSPTLKLMLRIIGGQHLCGTNLAGNINTFLVRCEHETVIIFPAGEVVMTTFTRDLAGNIVTVSGLK